MLRVWSALAVALASALPGWAGGDEPKGPAPLVRTVQPGKDGKPLLVQTVYYPETPKVPQTVIVNGRQEMVERLVMVQVTKNIMYHLDGPNIKVYDVDGKQLDVKTLKLTKATPVLVSAD